ncbi:hypothetical protein [Streptomyces lavendulocolor]|uniref:hypothetical protein n=1 Tax=Streptomyces lavendulocolor TaxID=67316 RepID=UPI0033D84493
MAPAACRRRADAPTRRLHAAGGRLGNAPRQHVFLHAAQACQELPSGCQQHLGAVPGVAVPTR